MEKLLAEVDGRLDGTDERLATEFAALRQAFENVKEAQEAVALDIIYIYAAAAQGRQGHRAAPR